jgi:hypothetical protein
MTKPIYLAALLVAVAGCGGSDVAQPKRPPLGGSYFVENDKTTRHVLSGREAAVAIMDYMERHGVEIPEGDFVFQIECLESNGTVELLLTPKDSIKSVTSPAADAKGGGE